MRTFVLLLLTIMATAVYGQKEQISYLSKNYKPVAEEKAAYKEIITEDNHIVTVRFIDIKKKIETVKHYKDHNPTGKWLTIKDGKTTIDYDFDQLIYITPEEYEAQSGLKYLQKDTPNVVQPSFPGGDQARIKFLMNNLYYPQYSRESGEQGTVKIAFIVTKDGDIVNPFVIQSAALYLDFEALRVIKLMPKWNPGTINGKPVDMIYQMPVKFTLAG